MKPNRIDRIIAELEKLQSDAELIIDAYVGSLAGKFPEGTGHDEIKRRVIAESAGGAIDTVSALKIVQRHFSDADSRAV